MRLRDINRQRKRITQGIKDVVKKHRQNVKDKWWNKDLSTYPAGKKIEKTAKKAKKYLKYLK